MDNFTSFRSEMLNKMPSEFPPREALLATAMVSLMAAVYAGGIEGDGLSEEAAKEKASDFGKEISEVMGKYIKLE